MIAHLHTLGDTTRGIPITMVLSSDGKSGATAKTLSIKASKNGAAPFTPAGSVAEVSAADQPGEYVFTPQAGDVDTLGLLTLYVTAASCDPCTKRVQIVAFDLYNATRGTAGTAIPNGNPNTADGFWIPTKYAGTAKNTSTSTRIVFNGTSGTLDTTQYVGWMAVLSNGDVSRVIATSTGDGTDYVDVSPAFAHGAPNSGSVTFILVQDMAAKVDSSLRVDVSKIAGQTAIATVSINFDNLAAAAAPSASTVAAAVWAYASRTLSAGQSLVIETQQFTQLELVRGNSYDSSARSLTVARADDAVWPTNLSDGWTWAFYASKHASNRNTSSPSSFTGTVSVETATGDDQTFRITIAAASIADAIGAYDFAIRGTNSGKFWDAVLGTLLIRDSAAEA